MLMIGESFIEAYGVDLLFCRKLRLTIDALNEFQAAKIGNFSLSTSSTNLGLDGELYFLD